MEVTDDTPVQRLSLLDQIRVVFKKLAYDPANELKREDAITVEYLGLKATLIKFLMTATEPIREGKKQKVNVLISSKFTPVYKEVLASKRFTAYYNITTYLPENQYKVERDFYVTLEGKKR